MPRWTAPLALGFALLPSLAAARAGDAREDVPAALRGAWGREGRCDVPADRLTITSRTAGWGEGPMNPVFYAPDEKAVHWDREYVVDNFVRSAGDPDVLIHDTEGFGTSAGEVGYARCRPGLARVLPWPPFKPGPVVPDPRAPRGHGARER